MNTTCKTHREVGMNRAPQSLLAPSVPARGPLEYQLDELKERLLQPIIGTIANHALATQLRWAANEAAALAWYTACPVLLLPTLLEEKVRAAWTMWERQQRISAQPTLVAAAR
jgi:hypothetical protein